VVFEGSRNLKRGGPAVSGTIRLAQAGWVGERDSPEQGVTRADAERTSSEEEPNSKRGTRGALVPRDKHDEEDPEVVPNGEGGAPEANEALRVAHRNLCRRR